LTDSNKTEIGKVVIRFPELDSTNDYASLIMSKTRPIEGTAIIADYQRAGKGQIGSKWESERNKNLTLSIILYPSFLKISDQHYLNFVASIAVCRLINRYIKDVQVSIKWPNDIYVGQKKMAGILIQNAITGGAIDYTIIGIGINVNQVNFSNELTNPSSLNLELGNTIPLSEVEAELYLNMTEMYRYLRNRRYAYIRDAYIGLLYKLGVESNFYIANQGICKKGIIKGIDEKGRIMIDFGAMFSTFDVKEIQYK
jgi:BirA family transcriptional regulator, biotin operon repressor / biotin---[acetyl-CoA-carboxylase] ligase